jgi:hypothetical protein
MVELNNSEQTFFRRNGARMPMGRASTGSESATTTLEDLSEDNVETFTFKEKASPDKGVDTELNSEVEILDLYEETARALRTDLMITREMVAWRGYGGIEGMIGAEGDSAHSDMSSGHVFTPSTAFSNTSTATPQDVFQNARTEINVDGTAFGRTGDMTAYVSPTVMRDLMQNDDLESRFSGVETQGLNQEQVASIIPFPNLELVRTQVVRTNADGEPIDDSDTVVDDPANAARDNILEPYDKSQGSVDRNIVIGMPGEASAFTPWFLNRLLERADDGSMRGQLSVNRSEGFMSQVWSTEDPLASWFKIAQDIGFHLRRPDNWAIIQDI